MFSSVLRSQARIALLTVARTAAVPASRSLSMLVQRHALVTSAPVVARITMTRAFSSNSNSEDGRVLPSSTIYVGNMPWDMNAEDMKEVFSEFGTVVAARAMTQSDGRSRGYGYVEFASVEEATAAINSGSAEPIHVGGRDLAVDFAVNRQNSSPPNKKLHFTGFSEGEAALRDLMGDLKGDVVTIYYLRDGNTGERLNSGFIEFKTIEQATEAMNKINGTEFAEGSLTLTYARAKRLDDRRNPRSDNRYPDRRNRDQYDGRRDQYDGRRDRDQYDGRRDQSDGRRDRGQYDGNRNNGRRDFQSRRDY